jgi:hypothetical protein
VPNLSCKSSFAYHEISGLIILIFHRRQHEWFFADKAI